MGNDKLQNEFEAAYVEEMVRVYGEAIRGAAQVAIDHKMPNGEYAAPMLRLGLWAWRASRTVVEDELSVQTKLANCWDRLNVHNVAISNSFREERDQLKGDLDEARYGMKHQAALSLKKEIERLNADNASLKGSCSQLGAEHTGMARASKTANRLLTEANAERDRLLGEVEALRLRIGGDEKKLDALLAHCDDGECVTCGQIICPHGDGMHFHHDGCPTCAQEDDQ